MQKYMYFHWTHNVESTLKLIQRPDVESKFIH